MVKIESVKVTGGSGYTNGTYYAPVFGDGTSYITSSGAIIRITVSGWHNSIIWINLLSQTQQYTQVELTILFGKVSLTNVFSDIILSSSTKHRFRQR